ncbi:hypothetical protein D3C75_955110 [compost metagenome]
MAFDVFQVGFQIVDPGQVRHATLSPTVAFSQAQVAGFDLFVLTQGVRPFEHVFQFPHIAREAIALQRIEGLGVESRRRLTGIGGQTLENVAG